MHFKSENAHENGDSYTDLPAEEVAHGKESDQETHTRGEDYTRLRIGTEIRARKTDTNERNMSEKCTREGELL